MLSRMAVVVVWTLLTLAACPAALGQSPPDTEALLAAQLVPITEFFVLPLTEGSIGCNLLPHPGIEVFRKVLEGLEGRDDVEAVYALVTGEEPDDEDGPFTDTVIVFGTISFEALRELLRPVQPDEVGSADSLGISANVLDRHPSAALAVWWD